MFFCCGAGPFSKKQGPDYGPKIEQLVPEPSLAPLNWAGFYFHGP